MILDTITNANVYAGLHAGVDMALKAMAAYTPENYQTGKGELDGDKVFLLRALQIVARYGRHRRIFQIENADDVLLAHHDAESEMNIHAVLLFV